MREARRLSLRHSSCGVLTKLPREPTGPCSAEQPSTAAPTPHLRPREARSAPRAQSVSGWMNSNSDRPWPRWPALSPWSHLQEHREQKGVSIAYSRENGHLEQASGIKKRSFHPHTRPRIKETSATPKSEKSELKTQIKEEKHGSYSVLSFQRSFSWLWRKRTEQLMFQTTNLYLTINFYRVF